MILHGDGSTNIFVKDGLLPFRFYEKPSAPNYLNISHSDSLYADKDVNANFDVVISNPPFSVNLDNRTKSYLDRSFLFGQKKNSENLFIERYYHLLREKGRLAVVLPESLFDTSDNKYTRLFLFKYFHIKAVVSLPQLTFEPYTSTKTSLLFAQKKTKSDIEKWNQLWNSISNEWGRLRTRVANYIKVYLEDADKNNYPSIKDDTEETTRQNIQDFLHGELTDEDMSLDIKGVLEKYYTELMFYSQIDNDLKDAFGFVNTTWVFRRLSSETDYPIFMADADNVGYKRRKNRPERLMPNDLFDMEIAPNSINRDRVVELYDTEIHDLKTKTDGLRKELEQIKNQDSSRYEWLSGLLNKYAERLSLMETEKEHVLHILDDFYDENNRLLEAYKMRHEEALLSVFDLRLMKEFRSNRIHVRTTDFSKILDFARSNVVWE